MARAERTLLPQLRERIRRIERPAAAHEVLSFGIAKIDRALPEGGLARGALHEILGIGGDEEDGALAAAFAADILGRLAATQDGIVLWCLPPTGSLWARPCFSWAGSRTRHIGPDAARCRDPVGDGGGVTHLRHRRGGWRSRDIPRGGESPAATRRGTLRHHGFFAEALAQWRTGGARTCVAECRDDKMADRRNAVPPYSRRARDRAPAVADRVAALPRRRAGLLGGGGGGGGCDGSCISGCRAGRSTGGTSLS